MRSRPPHSRLTSCLLAIVLSLATASAVSAATYHVAPGGDDATGTGAPGSPWRQIRRALEVVGPGDSVLVADGTYLGFTVSALGSTSAPIVIQAEGTAEIVPTNDRGGQYDPDNIAIWSSTNVVIDGFRSFGAKRAAVRIIASAEITIRNGVYGNNGIWAVVTSHSDDVVVEGCDLFGSREQHGIYFANSGDRPVARGNRIHHNFGSGIRAYGDSTQGGDGLVSGALFEDNRIYSNYGGGGMNLNAFKDAVIRNNLIYDNHASSGIALFLGEGGVGVGDVEILHNTIDVPADGKYNLRILGTQGPITLRNNVLYNRNPLRGFYSFGSATDAANTDGDFNAVGGTLFVSDDDEATRKTWATWIGAGHEPSSTIATAADLFVDEAARDYHLRDASPAIDAGVTLGAVAIDIEGRARPEGFASDVGAYEFPSDGPASCGDGTLQTGLGEQCDDGNRAGGDCCSADCQAEPAGDACAAPDVCLGRGTCDGAGACGDLAPLDCELGWQGGLLVVNETKPGDESLLLKLDTGDSMSQVDFGDPRSAGGTAQTLCVYDDADAPVGRLEIDRAGEACGRGPCWKSSGNPPNGKGYRYKDRARSASGISVFTLKGGATGRPKLLVKARNDADAGQTSLPTGLATALGGSTKTTIRLVSSDVSRCSIAELDTAAGGGALYRAER